MPFQIDGTESFRNAVLSAFAGIAPCYGATISGNTIVFDFGADCACLCRHPAGCNLVRALDGWDDIVKIVEAGSDGYNYKTNELRLDPSTNSMASSDMCAGRATTPAVMLAHELIHARHVQLGTYFYGALLSEEAATVRGENQIRLELCMPPRVQYSNVDVPQYWNPNIDDSNPPPCDCAQKPTFFPLTNHIPCLSTLCRTCKNPAIGLGNLLKILAGGAPRTSYGMPITSSNPDLERHLASADEELAIRIRLADRTRRRRDKSDVVRRLKRSMLASESGFVLEAVDLDGRYRVAIVYADGDEGLLLTTNFALRPGWEPGASTIYVGEVGDFRTLTVPSARVPELGIPDFPPGVGGVTTVIDGTVQFLSVKKGDEVREVALFGYKHPGFHSNPEEPEADLERWRAVNRAYEIWRDALRAAED